MKRRVRFFLLLNMVVTATVTAAGQQLDSVIGTGEATSQGEDQYRVRLGSVDLVPDSGFQAVAAERGDPFLIQFHQVPGVADRTRIEQAGIDLLRYVGGGSYLARCEVSCSDVFSSLPIRSTFDLTPPMKLASVFQADANLRTRLNSNSPLEVVVRFHPWIPWEQARLVLVQSGAASTATGLGYRNSVIAMVDSESLRVLLDHSEIAWVDPALPATGPSLVHAAERSRVDQVRGAAGFLGVDGSGTRVGVLDWFPAGIHTDLLVLFSAGNKRQVSFLGPHTHGDQHGNEDGVLHEDLHPPNPRYPSIAGSAIAKNVLTIGGTTKDDEINLFSSFGP